MKTTDLKNTSYSNPLRFSNEAGDTLEIFYQDGFPNWVGKFAMIFNCEFKSYKTLNGLSNNAERLVEERNLTPAAEDRDNSKLAVYYVGTVDIESDRLQIQYGGLVIGTAQYNKRTNTAHITLNEDREETWDLEMYLQDAIEERIINIEY